MREQRALPIRSDIVRKEKPRLESVTEIDKRALAHTARLTALSAELAACVKLLSLPSVLNALTA